MRSKYESDVLPRLDRIEHWVMMGATMREVADKLGIAYSAFRRYLSEGERGNERYQALAAVYARASVEPDDNVEAALYKLSTGYVATVREPIKVKRSKYDPATGRKVQEWEEIVYAEKDVYVPANVTAQQFWLANRRRGAWQYKPEAVDDKAEGTSGVVMMPEVDDGAAAPPPVEGDYEQQ